MMDFRFNRPIRIISIIVLFFFCWSFAGGLDIAYAIKNSDELRVAGFESKDSQKSNINRAQNTEDRTQKRERPEGKFQKAIEEIEQVLADTVTDIDTKKNKLKTKKAEIEAFDVEIKKQLAETEKKLKEAGLPPEILERHYKFVKHYEDNLNELKANLDAIEKHRAKSIELEEAIKKAKAHLEKVKPPKKHVPLDPNKLPHRTVEPMDVPLLNYSEQVSGVSGQENEDSDQLSVVGFQKKTNNKPILVASIGSLAGLLSSTVVQATNQPTPADPAETIEVKFTPEIINLADSLGGTPIDLYEYVRNTFKYEPYAGSVKGAVQTLKEKAGNEWDLASLLIALFRAKGIPARYVVGTVEMPIDKAMSWLGVEDPNMTGTMLASNGGPTALITSGGKITALETQHVWVQAYISFLPSRGVSSGPGDTWVNMDPSFKTQTSSQAQNLSGVPIFNQENYLASFRTESAYDYYRNQLQGFLNINAAGYRPEALMRINEINPEWFGILMGQLPHKIKSVPATYSEVPDFFRQKFSISIINALTEVSQLSYTASLPQIIGKRLTLSYIPASAADQATVTTYGNTLLTPPYLIKLKPVLKLEGTTIVEGNPVGPGDQQRLVFNFKTAIGTDRIENTIIAGEYYAIGLNAQTSGERGQILERTEKLQTINETINFNDLATLDDRLGEILYLSAMVYHQNLNQEICKISQLHKVVDIRQVSEMMYFLELKVDTVFDIPYKISPAGITADMDRDIHLVIPIDGDTNRIKPYMQLIGNLSSYFEHAVTEGIYQTKAISAVKAIQLAHDQGITVHTITKQNINSKLPLLQISEQVKNGIANAINAGREAIVPERNVTLYDWNGVGYIIQDPARGNGAYLISGGFGGGTFVIAIGVIDNVELTPVSTIASQANQRTIKNAICYPGGDNMLFSEDDNCYTVVEFGDIDQIEKNSCGENNDPGCRQKYAVSHEDYAMLLIDYYEHNMFTLLSKNVTAWDWQSQDNARYMRAGRSVLFAIETLLEAFKVTEHNLRPVGSGYRTQYRNKSLKPDSSDRSFHMDGVAADTKLAYSDGTLVRKCEVLDAAYLIIDSHGEIRSEDTKTKKKDTVHIAVMASPYNDRSMGFWGCK